VIIKGERMHTTSQHLPSDSGRFGGKVNRSRRSTLHRRFWPSAALAGLLLFTPSMYGPAIAQTAAERAEVARVIGEPQAEALLTVWGAVNDLAEAWSRGQFEADRAADFAASYRASAEQVAKLALLAMPANPDAAPVVSGAGSLVRQAALLVDWIASGDRAPPADYTATKAATDALMLNRRETASVPADPEISRGQQEIQLKIVASQSADGSPGPIGTMRVVHTSDLAPDQVTWTYDDGSSDQGLGVPLPGTGAFAVSFGTGAKSIHLYRLRKPGGDRRSIEGLWAPALAGETIRPVNLAPRDSVMTPTSFHIEGGGTFSIDKRTAASALQVKWTFPTGEFPGLGIIYGDYLAAIVIDPGDRGGVALYQMSKDGSSAISRWVVTGSKGVGKEELAVVQLPAAAAKADLESVPDLDSEIREIAGAIREDLGNAARWKPTTSQINSISATKAAADKLRAYVQSVYAELTPGQAGARANQTEIIVTGPDLSELAGGYRQEMKHFRPGIAIYGFKFVEPGKDSGMRYDGLIHVRGEWIFIPKAWRAFR